jgi:hypothetical protein
MAGCGHDDGEREGWLYPGNQPPLQSGVLVRLPFGSIRAQGWLAEQMRLQAKGITDGLDGVFPDVGPRSAWLGGDGEAWERGPYYWRGLVALAAVTGDDAMRAKAKPWIEWTLASQQADGNFGTWRQDWWPRMIVCQALTWHYEQSRDPRVIPFLERYFLFQASRIAADPLKEWGLYRGGDNIEPILWLYNRDPDPRFLRLARILQEQTFDWTRLFTAGDPIEGGSFIEHRHGVNIAHGLKLPGLLGVLRGGKSFRQASASGLALLDRFYGQVHGVYAGDEPVAPTSGFHGSELCTTVEYLHSLGVLLEAVGDPFLADRMERAAFNALPAALLPDGKGYQYYIQPNCVDARKGPRGFQTDHGSNLTPGGISGYPCCAVNMHYAWPWVTQNLFMAAPHGGLAAVIYAPCEVVAKTGAGQSVTLTETTDYPFKGKVRIELAAAAPVSFPLLLRIPRWCAEAKVTVNGETQPAPVAGTFVRVERTWKAGDRVELELPMELRFSRWENQSVVVERGPLVFALKVGESWRNVGPHEELKGAKAADYPNWEIVPTTDWNLALVADQDDPGKSLKVQEGQVSLQPFGSGNAPMRILATARKVKTWGLDGYGNAQPPPTSPVVTDEPARPVTLVPFACTKLRITYLPVASR